MQLVLVLIQLIGFFSAFVESLSHGETQGASKAASDGDNDVFSTELLNLIDTIYEYDESNGHRRHIIDFSPWFTAKCGYQDDSPRGTPSKVTHQIMCDIERDNQKIGYFAAIYKITSFQDTNVYLKPHQFDIMKLGFGMAIKNKLLTDWGFKLSSRIDIEWNGVDKWRDQSTTIPFKFKVRGKVGADQTKFTQGIGIHAPIVNSKDNKSETIIRVDIKSDVPDHKNLRSSWKRFVMPDGSSQVVLKEMHEVSECGEWKFEGLKFFGIPVVSIPKCNRFILLEQHHHGNDTSVNSTVNYQAFDKEKKVNLHVITAGKYIDVTLAGFVDEELYQIYYNDITNGNSMSDILLFQMVGAKSQILNERPLLADVFAEKVLESFIWLFNIKSDLISSADVVNEINSFFG